MKISRAGSALAVAALSIGLLASCAADGGGAPGGDGAASGEPIKVGVTGPMGHIYGDWQKVATQAAADKINAEGGMDGRPVELVWADTEANPTKAVTEVTRLIRQEKVDFIVGPSTSGETLAMAPLLTQANIASMPSAGSEEITPETLPYGFGVLATSGQQVELIVETLVAQGHKNIAIIHDDGVLATEAAATINKEASKAGLTIVGEQAYKLSAADVSAQVLALRQAEPDALIFWGTTAQDAGRVVQALDQNAWDVPVLANTAALSASDVIAVAGPDAFANMAVVAPTAFSACSVEDVRPQTKDFIDQVREAAGAEEGTLSYFYMSYFYDGLTWLDAAVDAIGDTDGKKVAAWLEENAMSVAHDLPLAGTGWGISADSRHAFTVDGIAMVDPGTVVSDGIYQATECG